MGPARDPHQNVLLDGRILPEDVHTLLRAGIGRHILNVLKVWDAGVEKVKQKIGLTAQKQSIEARRSLNDDVPFLLPDLQRRIVSHILNVYS